MVPELSLGHPRPRAFEMGTEWERERERERERRVGGEGVGVGSFSPSLRLLTARKDGGEPGPFPLSSVAVCFDSPRASVSSRRAMGLLHL